jgi:AbrB family looped-hinge helix DNA binding protein
VNGDVSLVAALVERTYSDPTVVGYMSADRRIDAKGRVTIPRDLRDRLGLEPGTEVRIEVKDGEIMVRAAVDRTAATERLRGCIDEKSRREDAEPVDPLTLKDDWTSDL